MFLFNFAGSRVRSASFRSFSGFFCCLFYFFKESGVIMLHAFERLKIDGNVCGMAFQMMIQYWQSSDQTESTIPKLHCLRFLFALAFMQRQVGVSEGRMCDELGFPLASAATWSAVQLTNQQTQLMNQQQGCHVAAQLTDEAKLPRGDSTINGRHNCSDSDLLGIVPKCTNDDCMMWRGNAPDW